MRKRYPIELARGLGNTVYYPAELEGSLPLLQIVFGNRVLDIDCSPHPKGKNVIVLSPDIQTQLCLPDIDAPLHLFIDSQTLYIGPLIGILTSGFTPYPIRPIGDRSMFFAKLLSANKMVGALPFVFGEEHIDWDECLINGYFYGEDGWKTLKVPFPNVIYDRLPNRKSERKTEIRKVKERLQDDYLIPWYNPGFFNKIDVFERLQQVGRAAEYLPETHPFTSFSLIERMLADYGHVYIKPSNGSLGLGIRQVIYDKMQGYYYCRYRDYHGHNKLTKFESLESLMKHVFRKQRLENFLVQQGIHLLRTDRRLIDFRVHTNKDEQGKWHVAAIAAKVAGPGSVTTHVNNGGVIKTIEELFPDKEEQRRYKKQLAEACLYLSTVLEQQMEGIIAEIGFDLGIDKNGKVWLFEANSKPGRSIFKHPELRDFDLLTRKLPLAFGIFLAEQAITSPGEIFK
ncbi:YheC/YheD family endospore coat-associated protein [Bacillus sp. T33-2]|uniref:YheC/YheD family endospore coat-associated protein n=1 Tax=Bacillus sp. T33-2 TaxID=2054168 RepID=UPI000C77E293|nr:YheC/YheD family protein [Bacillus sp. T33-2]PLR89937.1 glutathione synthetase [Bacillus sp. T33-2]